MNKIFASAIIAAISLSPMVASAQSYEGYRQQVPQSYEGYRPAPPTAPSFEGYRQAAQQNPRWDSINTQVLPPVRNFDRVSSNSDDFADSQAQEYQPEPQRCGTGQMFIVSPDNTTTHKQVTMCQNNAGLWAIKR